MGTRPEPDDVEARFRAIMDAEFGPGSTAADPTVPGDDVPGADGTWDVGPGAGAPGVDGSRPAGPGQEGDPDRRVARPAGDQGTQGAARPGTAPRATGPTHRADTPPTEPFNLAESMDRADPTPDEPQLDDFVQPSPHLGRPSLRTAAALVLFGLALATVVADLLGWIVPGIVGTLAICCFVASVVLVFTGLRREPRDPWDDGSRV